MQGGRHGHAAGFTRMLNESLTNSWKPVIKRNGERSVEHQARGDAAEFGDASL